MFILQRRTGMQSMTVNKWITIYLLVLPLFHTQLQFYLVSPSSDQCNPSLTFLKVVVLVRAEVFPLFTLTIVM